MCRLPYVDLHVDFKTRGFKIVFRHKSASATVNNGTSIFFPSFHFNLLYIITILFIYTITVYCRNMIVLPCDKSSHSFIHL